MFSDFLLLAPILALYHRSEGSFMARHAKVAAHPNAPLAGDTLDVSRIEHENLSSEVVTNRRRFERNERRIMALERTVEELKRLLQVLQADPPIR
jgi:hypothetical protein